MASGPKFLEKKHKTADHKRRPDLHPAHSKEAPVAEQRLSVPDVEQKEFARLTGELFSKISERTGSSASRSVLRYIYTLLLKIYEMQFLGEYLMKSEAEKLIPLGHSASRKKYLNEAAKLGYIRFDRDAKDKRKLLVKPCDMLITEMRADVAATIGATRSALSRIEKSIQLKQKNTAATITQMPDVLSKYHMLDVVFHEQYGFGNVIGVAGVRDRTSTITVLFEDGKEEELPDDGSVKRVDAPHRGPFGNAAFEAKEEVKPK